jgi:hypothetical protein
MVDSLPDSGIPDDGIGLFYLVSQEVDDKDAHYNNGIGRLLTGPPGKEGVRQVGVVNLIEPRYNKDIMGYMHSERKGIPVKYLQLLGQSMRGVRIVVAPTDKTLDAAVGAFYMQLDFYSANIGELPSSVVTETGTFAKKHLKIA